MWRFLALSGDLEKKGTFGKFLGQKGKKRGLFEKNLRVFEFFCLKKKKKKFL